MGGHWGFFGIFCGGSIFVKVVHLSVSSDFLENFLHDVPTLPRFLPLHSPKWRSTQLLVQLTIAPCHRHPVRLQS